MSGRKKCFRCETLIERHHDVCPNCRERQPASATPTLWVIAVASLLAWIAFR